MVWGITAATFLGTVAILTALFYAFAPNQLGIGQRLSRLANASAPAYEARFADRQKERVRDTLAGLGKLMPGDPAMKPRGQLLMVRAGYRSQQAVLAMRGLKLAVPVALLILVFTTGFYRLNPYMLPVLAAIVGYLVPEAWLVWRVHARQHRLRRALPKQAKLRERGNQIGRAHV